MADLSKVTAVRVESVGIFTYLSMNCFLTQPVFNRALLTSHIIIPEILLIKWNVLTKGYIPLLAAIYIGSPKGW